MCLGTWGQLFVQEYGFLVNDDPMWRILLGALALWLLRRQFLEVLERLGSAVCRTKQAITEDTEGSGPRTVLVGAVVCFSVVVFFVAIYAAFSLICTF